MATNHARLPQRRFLGQRAKVDENAMSKHVRQPSNGAAPAGARFMTKENPIKVSAQRVAISEVTGTAVNRKETKLTSGKEKDDVGPKRARLSTTVAPQRVPLAPTRVQVAPPVAHTVNVRAPVRVTAPSNAGLKRPTRAISEQIRAEIVEREEDHQMDVEVEEDEPLGNYDEDEQLINEREVEVMVGIESDEEVDDIPAPISVPKPAPVWPQFPTERKERYRREVEAIRESYQDEVDIYDTTMVCEYAEEIFEYMNELEEEVMPNPHYMDGQNEISWSMRQTLVDWLLQVHLRYHMLPETLWIAVNIVDRFLAQRVVSLLKLQLVGVTAMFIAAKYEEILAPSVEEFVFMTEKGYTKEEILKGERIMLQVLGFRISHYCSPYSWMRKISKADDYDIQTRTLSKFLTEVTLLDYRFLSVKPSLIAAVGMYCARQMLGGDWNEAFVFHSGYTEEQLIPGHKLLVEKLTEDNFHRQYVCKKYANKKFLKASVFAIEWARSHLNDLDDTSDDMAA